MTSAHVLPATEPLSRGTQAWENAQSQLPDAAQSLGYDDGLHQLLARPRREMTVSVPLRRDNGDVEVLTGYRVQHNFSRGPAKGGLRFSPDVSCPWMRCARSQCG